MRIVETVRIENCTGLDQGNKENNDTGDVISKTETVSGEKIGENY